MGVAEVVAVLRANTSQFTAKLDEAELKIQKLSKSGASNFEKMGAVGKVAFLGLAGGAIAVGVASIAMGEKFQSSMELIHTQAGASQGEVDKMSKAVLNLAGQTGTGPNELAAGLFHLESAGMRGKTALEALKIAAEGAKVGHANLEDVTNALNAAVASGIPGVQNMSQAMGALNSIVGSGDMRMQDLADALSTGVLASVKSFGLNLKDVGGALATFGDNNVRGANAATMLRQSVMALAVGAKGGGKALGEIGLTSKQLATDMSTGGLTKALTDLHTHLVETGHTGANAGALLTEAFGKKAGPGIAILTDQFSRFQSKTKEVGAGGKNFGSDWTATTHTLAFQMDQAKATVQELGTKLGVVLIPKLESAMKAVEQVVNWLKNHKDVAAALGVVIGGALATAIGVFITLQTVAAAKATITAGKMVYQGVQAVIAAVKWAVSMIPVIASYAAVAIGATAMGIAAAAAWVMGLGPIGLLIAAIAAVIAIVVLIFTHWGAVSNFFKKLWADIKHIFLEAIDAVVGFFKKWWPEILGVVTGGIGLLIAELIKHWGTIKHDVLEAIDAVVGFFTKLPGRIVTALKDFAKTIFADLMKVGSWFDTNVLPPVVNFFTSLPGKIVTGLGDIVSTIWHALLNTTVWFVNNVELPVIRWFAGLPKKAYDALGNLMKTIWADLMKIGLWYDTNVLVPALAWFKALPGKAYTALGNLMTTIWADLLKIGSWMETNVFVPLHVWFAALPGKAKTALGDIVGTVFADLLKIASWLDTNVWQPVSSFFSGLPGKIGSAIQSGLGALGGIGKSIMNGIITGLDDAIHTVNGITSAIPIFGSSMHIPDIPHLAAGGIVPATPGGMLAILGEGGQDEAVIPLGNRSNARSGGSSGTTNNYYNNTYNVVSNDPQTVIDAIRRYNQRNGSLANAGIT